MVRRRKPATARPHPGIAHRREKTVIHPFSTCLNRETFSRCFIPSSLLRVSFFIFPSCPRKGAPYSAVNVYFEENIFHPRLESFESRQNFEELEMGEGVRAALPLRWRRWRRRRHPFMHGVLFALRSLPVVVSVRSLGDDPSVVILFCFFIYFYYFPFFSYGRRRHRSQVAFCGTP